MSKDTDCCTSEDTGCARVGVYENDYYTVEVVNALLTEPADVQCYGLVNKVTSVREGEFMYFPQAVQYADQLSDSIAEWEAAEDPTDVAGEDKPAIQLAH